MKNGLFKNLSKTAVIGTLLTASINSHANDYVNQINNILGCKSQKTQCAGLPIGTLVKDGFVKNQKEKTGNIIINTIENINDNGFAYSITNKGSFCNAFRGEYKGKLFIGTAVHCYSKIGDKIPENDSTPVKDFQLIQEKSFQDITGIKVGEQYIRKIEPLGDISQGIGEPFFIEGEKKYGNYFIGGFITNISINKKENNYRGYMHIKSDELEKIEGGPFGLSGSPVINTQGNVVGVLSDTVSGKDGFFYGLIISFFPPEIK